MKKILSILLIMVMTMPLVVKADVYPPKYYYNSNIVVGGELQLEVQLNSNYLLNVDETIITYDETMLKVEKSDIKVYACSYDVTNSENLNLIVNNGEIKISSKGALIQGCTGDDPSTKATIHFSTLKEGTAKIKLTNDHYMCGGAPCGDIILESVVKSPICPNTADTNSVVPKEEVKQETKEELNEETTEEPKEEFGDDNVEIETTNDKETKKTDTLKKTDLKRDNTLFYISLIINVLQLIAFIVLILLNKKKNISRETRAQEEAK